MTAMSADHTSNNENRPTHRRSIVSRIMDAKKDNYAQGEVLVDFPKSSLVATTDHYAEDKYYNSGEQVSEKKQHNDSCYSMSLLRPISPPPAITSRRSSKQLKKQMSVEEDYMKQMANMQVCHDSIAQELHANLTQTTNALHTLEQANKKLIDTVINLRSELEYMKLLPCKHLEESNRDRRKVPRQGRRVSVH